MILNQILETNINFQGCFQETSIESESEATLPNKLNELESKKGFASCRRAATLTDLPNLVLRGILNYLSASLVDLLSFSMTCKRFETETKNTLLHLSIRINPVQKLQKNFTDQSIFGVEILSFIRMRTQWKVWRLIVGFEQDSHIGLSKFMKGICDGSDFLKPSCSLLVFDRVDRHSSEQIVSKIIKYVCSPTTKLAFERVDSVDFDFNHLSINLKHVSQVRYTNFRNPATAIAYKTCPNLEKLTFGSRDGIRTQQHAEIPRQNCLRELNLIGNWTDYCSLLPLNNKPGEEIIFPELKIFTVERFSLSCYFTSVPCLPKWPVFLKHHAPKLKFLALDDELYTEETAHIDVLPDSCRTLQLSFDVFKKCSLSPFLTELLIWEVPSPRSAKCRESIESVIKNVAPFPNIKLLMVGIAADSSDNHDNTILKLLAGLPQVEMFIIRLISRDSKISDEHPFRAEIDPTLDCYVNCRAFYVINGFVKLDEKLEPRLLTRVIKLAKNFLWRFGGDFQAGHEDYDRLSFVL